MLGNQVIERHGPGCEVLNRSVVRWGDADRIVVPDHLADHRARDAKVSRKRGRPSLPFVQPFLELFHGGSLTYLKASGLAFPEPVQLNIDDVRDYRRAQFKELLKTRFGGSRAKLAEEAGISNARITQLLDPKEAFGDTAVRRLVEKLGLPKDYFELTGVDIPLPLPSAEALKIAIAWDQMSPQERARLDNLMAAALDLGPSSTTDAGGLSGLGGLDEGKKTK